MSKFPHLPPRCNGGSPAGGYATLMRDRLIRRSLVMFLDCQLLRCDGPNGSTLGSLLFLLSLSEFLFADGKLVCYNALARLVLLRRNLLHA
jgi:hypothetical protein